MEGILLVTSHKASVVLDIEQLLSQYGNSKNHHIGNAKSILPFTASVSNPKIYNNLMHMYGEYVRKISGIELDEKESLDLLSDSFIEKLIKKINFSHESDIAAFKEFYKSFFFDRKEIRPTHPYFYNLLGLDSKLEAKKFSSFLYDILLIPNNKFKKFFSSVEASDLLHELLLTNIDFIVSNDKEHEPEYQNLIPTIGELYRADIDFLLQHEKYFLKNFPLLTKFYMFMYVCQLMLKFEQFQNADFTSLDSFYFALDWESLSRRRNAATGPGSYRHIRESKEFLFPHVHTLSHLSHNTFEKSSGKKNKILTYPEIYGVLLKMNEEQQSLFLNSLKKWIEQYAQLGLKNNPVNIDLSDLSLQNGFNKLHAAITQGMNSSSRERYGKNLEHIGKGEFLKARGNLGFVFNITSEFLLLLTAVSVKSDRIPLKHLFKEFRMRGIKFDYRSKREVVKFLESLNLIDKKSDSGDAQYVNKIL